MKHDIPVFDGDGHVLEPDRELAEHYEGRWTGNRRLEGMTIFPSLDGWSRSSIVEEGDEGRRYWSTDSDIWAEILDKIGLEGSVLYPTSGLAYGLMQSEEFQTATCIAYNNWLEEHYTRKDSRLWGVGLIPYGDVEAAKKEVARCATERTNFGAMLLPTVTVNGKYFGDECYWPIYEEAERQGMTIAFHGAVSRGFGLDNLKPFLKVHTLEHPVPLMIQMTDMMFNGVFETFPNLKFAFLEGGCSWITFMMDRLDYELDSVFGVPVRLEAVKEAVRDHPRHREHLAVLRDGREEPQICDRRHGTGPDHLCVRFPARADRRGPHGRRAGLPRRQRVLDGGQGKDPLPQHQGALRHPVAETAPFAPARPVPRRPGGVWRGAGTARCGFFHARSGRCISAATPWKRSSASTARRR